MTFTNQQYEFLKEFFTGQRYPLAFVDVEPFGANMDRVKTYRGKGFAFSSIIEQDGILLHNAEETQ
jgi:hypothetical protein